MSLIATSEFDRRWGAMWATTYTFDLAFFDQFLFRRLGDPPLSVNILADHDRLMSVWASVESKPWLLRRANRDYLIRGVRLPHGRFHPKTYFFANQERGILLVGSGNLGMHGLADGQEVFCRFDSREPKELDAIRSWYGWLNSIIVQTDDRTLAVRWRELARQAPWLPGVAVPSAFVTNVERPLIAQVDELVAERPVDELHVHAPFFDEDATAFEVLIQSLRPRAVHLYRSTSMNLDGDKVRDVVMRTGVKLRLFRFDHDDFVHAKLVGVVLGDTGVLLSGSANCSRSALLWTMAHGNAEAGILANTDAETIRATFCPPQWNVNERPLTELDALTYRQEDRHQSPWSVRLLSAAWKADGTISVLVDDQTDACVTRVAIAPDRSYLLTNGHTTSKVDLEDNDRVAWLVDENGERCSNSVPIDDTRQLALWLGDRRTTAEHPRGLHTSDLNTPLGKLLQWLHQECIFDVDETPAMAGFSHGGPDLAEEHEAEAGFWEQIQGEQLRLDPRASRYARLANYAEALDVAFDDDGIFQLLQIMRDQAPGEHSLLRHVGETSPDHGKSDLTWTPAHSVQVRFGNVLKRWIRAMGDERLQLLSRLAGVRNYIALLTTLLQSHIYGYLRSDRIMNLTRDLLLAFNGESQRPGYVMRLTLEERAQAMKLLTTEMASNREDGRHSPATLGAVMVYTLLSPQSNWTKVAFDWQPVLIQAIELGVIHAGQTSTTLLSDMGFPNRSADEVNKHLRQIAQYMNDDRWSEVAEEDLSLNEVRLEWNGSNPKYPLTIFVDGVADTLKDPRLVSLVRRALDYRRPAGVAIRLTNGDRLSFQRGGRAYAIVAGKDYGSVSAITETLLTRLEELGAGWGSELTRSP